MRQRQQVMILTRSLTQTIFPKFSPQPALQGNKEKVRASTI